MAKKDIKNYKDEILNLKQEIAGEICISENPGNTLKKWQNIFEITQIGLARQIKISASTLSDYENGRRNNPGIQFIKRFVNTLIEIDLKRKGMIIKKLITLPQEQLFETKEFKKGIKIKNTFGLKDLPQANTKNAKELVFGITYLDAQIIPDLELSDIQRLFGKTNKRILYISNSQDFSLINLFLKNQKMITNLNPTILILETKKPKEEINKIIDINVPIFITDKNKEEIKNMLKDL